MTRLIRQAAVFSQVIGVLTFGAVLCVYHAEGSAFVDSRPLVAVEWFVVAVSTGLISGLLFAWFLGSKSDTEDTLTVALLGMVLFTSGFAFALQLSPLLVCVVAGAAVANASPAWKELKDGLDAMSRPVLAVVLFIAAAIWQLPPTGTWMLVIGYILARTLARHIGGSFAAMSTNESDERPVERIGLSLVVQGGLVVAMALNTWLLFDLETSNVILTCLLVAGLINEIPGTFLVQNILADENEISTAANTEGSMEAS